VPSAGLITKHFAKAADLSQTVDSSQARHVSGYFAGPGRVAGFLVLDRRDRHVSG
jgi:hypothetical protein